MDPEYLARAGSIVTHSDLSPPPTVLINNFNNPVADHGEALVAKALRSLRYHISSA